MRQLRSSDFRKKIDFSKNYLETLLAFYFSTGEERENISKERRDSLCFRFKRRRRKIYQIIFPATPFLPPGLLASAPYFSLIRSILFCLGPRKPDSLSPPSPPSSKTFFSPWSFNFASPVGIHSFPVGLDHRGCKITPSAQLFTIFVRESGGFRHGSNGSNNRCVYLLCKRGTCSHARNPNNLISFLPHTAELWRPILSLINVPNNRGATWLQHGNSLGNWSERWRDFGYIERVCSSRAWNKFPFASSLSISFFSSFPPLCSDRSSFRIRLLPRILRISVFLYSNPWDVRIFIKEETIRTILVNEKHGRKRKSWTLFN